MINYDIAKKELEAGITSHKDFFMANGYNLEFAYCVLLEGNLSLAEQEFRKIDSIRADWALKLIPFMRGYVEILPSYFQVRNFLEIDLNLLIQAKQSDSVSYILGGADIFYSVNCEAYKYIARVLMNTGYPEFAKTYMDKACNATYNDPELHFMLCKYYIDKYDYNNALKYIDRCLNILPEYYPALKIKNELKTIENN